MESSRKLWVLLFVLYIASLVIPCAIADLDIDTSILVSELFNDEILTVDENLMVDDNLLSEFEDISIDYVSNKSATTNIIKTSSDGNWQFEVLESSPHECLLTAYLGEAKDIIVPYEIDNNYLVIGIPKPSYFFYDGLNADSVVLSSSHDFWNDGYGMTSATMTTDDGNWTYRITISSWPQSAYSEASLIYKPHIILDSYNGSEDNISVPETLHDYPVYTIHTHAICFSNAKNITLPETLLCVYHEAFYKCPNLEIVIPNSVIDMEDKAVLGCKKVTINCKLGRYLDFPETEPIVLMHSPITDPAVDPTCSTTGLTEGTHCSVCNGILEAQQTIPALGHTPVTDPAVAPTVTSTGLTEGAHCAVCGEILVKQKTVPKLISIKQCTIADIKDATYTGKAIQPSPTVKYGGKKLAKGTDYTITYANNKAIGTATVTITGIDKYGEAVKKTFTINPKAVALSAVSAGKNQLTVKWKKGKAITGYEVQYCLKKSFAGAKTIVIKKAGAVKTVLKGLTPSKTYFVRVRAYKAVGNKIFYSAWSKVKSAKPKK